MDGTVTQTGTTSTAVTLNVACGRITTVSSSAASGTGFQFVVNNTAIDADSVVLAQILDYSGTYITNGFPVLAISVMNKGFFTLAILNTGANAFNGTFTIGFQCL